MNRLKGFLLTVLVLVFLIQGCLINSAVRNAVASGLSELFSGTVIYTIDEDQPIEEPLKENFGGEGASLEEEETEDKLFNHLFRLSDLDQQAFNNKLFPHDDLTGLTFYPEVVSPPPEFFLA